MSDQYDEQAERLVRCNQQCAYDWKDGSLKDSIHHSDCAAEDRPAVAAALRQATQKAVGYSAHRCLCVFDSPDDTPSRVCDYHRRLTEFARDSLAGLRRSEFWREHKTYLSSIPTAPDKCCIKCGVESNWDPRHNFIWEEWQAVADKEMEGENL